VSRYCFVVFTTPTEGNDDEFNAWYDGQHLSDVLQLPGFLSAQRLRVPDGSSDLPGTYLALYQIETDDPDGCLQHLREVAGTPAMLLSPTLDLSKVRSVLCPVIVDRARER
jgi:hypothetical protein